MDRRRNRRARRPARRHPRKLRLRRFPRRRRRSTTLSEPATIRTDPRSRLPRTCRSARPALRNRHGGCSPCRSRLRARLWKPICGHAASRLCTTSTACGSIRAATIVPIADAPTETWPAMIAAVTDLDGQHHRRASHLARSGHGRDKAPIDTPRRAMGHLLGHAVRFGAADDVMAAGEGIETMLSLRCVMPDHADGRSTFGRSPRSHPASGHAASPLHRPRRRSGRRWCGGRTVRHGRSRPGSRRSRCRRSCGDFNEDLRSFGIDALRAALRVAARPGRRRPLLEFERLDRNGDEARRRSDGASPDRQAFSCVSERAAPTAF